MFFTVSSMVLSSMSNCFATAIPIVRFNILCSPKRFVLKFLSILPFSFMFLFILSIFISVLFLSFPLILFILFILSISVLSISILFLSILFILFIFLNIFSEFSFSLYFKEKCVPFSSNFTSP